MARQALLAMFPILARMGLEQAVKRAMDTVAALLAANGVFKRMKKEMFYNADWSDINISVFTF